MGLLTKEIGKCREVFLHYHTNGSPLNVAWQVYKYLYIHAAFI